MAFYIYTGKLGGGKTLCAVGRIKERLEKGLPVATNLDLRLDKLFTRTTKNLQVIRVPDKPCLQDLENIGRGNESYDESKNGLLVLDECGTWFNSRNWNDKTRKAVNDWFLHARKLGWDVILIIQDISILDSQAREALAEHTAFCKRTDRLQIPIIGSFYKAITGYRLTLPRMHSARVVYGTSEKDLLSDRHAYRGTALYSAYDTKQLFLEDYPHSTHSVLTPWHRFGRYQVTRNLEFYMRMTKIYLKRFRVVTALGLGSAFGVVVAVVLAMAITTPDTNAAEPADPVATADNEPQQVELPTLPPAEFFEVSEHQFAGEFIESLQSYNGYIAAPGREVYLVTADNGTIMRSTDFADLGITMIRRGDMLTMVHGQTYRTLMPSAAGGKSPTINEY